MTATTPLPARDRAQRRTAEYAFIVDPYWSTDYDDTPTTAPRIRHAATALDVIELGGRAAEWLRGWHGIGVWWQ